MRIIHLFLLIFATLLFACNPDKDKKVNNEEIPFKSTESSRMFFKNTRLLFYDLEEHTPTKREMYRMSNRMLTDSTPVLNLCIVNDWQNDAAYLMLEPNGWFKPPYDISLTATDPITEKKESLYYKMGNVREQFLFASEIYDALLDGKRFQVEKDGESYEMLSSKDEREAFRLTMFDYYRLIDGFNKKNLAPAE